MRLVGRRDGLLHWGGSDSRPRPQRAIDAAAGGRRPHWLVGLVAVFAAFVAGAIAASVVLANGRTSIEARGALTIADVFARSANGIVHIEVTPRSGGASYSAGPGREVLQPSGSGFGYGAENVIVTALHVVAGASAIRVRLSNGRSLPARYVAGDRDSDIALLEVEAPAGALRPLPLGDSSRVDVGDGVVAIGSPFGMQNSVTAGIVSSVGRTFRSPDNSPIANGIQTDAAINHGNSGGPLLDLNGDVIGLVAQFMSSSGGSNGVGLAVPSNTVSAVVARLLARQDKGRT